MKRTAHSPEISVSLKQGEVLGIAGLVGSGRTETMRAIFGADKIESGKIYIMGEQVRIRSPKDAVQQGLCLLTEDRKSQGLMLDLGTDVNITITDLKKISRRESFYVDILHHAIAHDSTQFRQSIRL